MLRKKKENKRRQIAKKQAMYEEQAGKGLGFNLLRISNAAIENVD